MLNLLIPTQNLLLQGDAVYVLYFVTAHFSFDALRLCTMTASGPVDLAPKRKNPWGDALSSIFSGSFCDPDKEPTDDDDHEETNGLEKPVGRSGMQLAVIVL